MIGRALKMWMGTYTAMSLLGLFIQSTLIQNILLFYFLGMCSYLACSNRIQTANGLGLAVTFVLFISGTLNWFVHQFVTAPGALSWLSVIGVNAADIDLSFLELLIYISVIAAFVQVLEIVIDKFSPALYAALGVYLPLITVNCAILGASLFATVREYAFVPNLVYMVGTGLGWWLAILLIASIREKLTYSHIPKYLQGMAITFIMTGLMALAFMAFTGINLEKKSEKNLSELITKL